MSEALKELTKINTTLIEMQGNAMVTAPNEFLGK